MLVGEGARGPARDLVTERCAQKWMKHREMFEKHMLDQPASERDRDWRMKPQKRGRDPEPAPRPSKRQRTGDEEGKEELEEQGSHLQLDTVGAVCCDREGRSAAGVSSGGISLKHAARAGSVRAKGRACMPWFLRSSSAGRRTGSGVLCLSARHRWSVLCMCHFWCVGLP